MGYALLWFAFFGGFLSGPYFILKGWRKYRDEPEAFQIWHIFGSESYRNHGINWIIEGVLTFLASLWLLYVILFVYNH